MDVECSIIQHTSDIIYFDVKISDIKITYMDPEYIGKHVNILINFDNYKKVTVKSNEKDDRDFMFYGKKVEIDYETKFGGNLDQKNLIISIVKDDKKIASGFIDLLTIANGKIMQKIPLIKNNTTDIYCFVEFNIKMQNYSEIGVHIKNLKITSERNNKFYKLLVEFGFSGVMVTESYRTKQNNSSSEWDWDNEDVFIVVQSSLFELVDKYLHLNVFKKGRFANKKIATINIPIIMNDCMNDNTFYNFSQKILLPNGDHALLSGSYYFTNLPQYIQDNNLS